METLLFIGMFLIRILHVIAFPFYAYKAWGKKKVVPPLQSDLLKISATKLAKKIRSGEILSEELCKTYIKRIKEVEPFINAVVEDRFEAALEDAKNVDKFILTCSKEIRLDLEKTKPLLGVPFTVKESCSLKGLSCSVGSITRKGYKANEDSEMVVQLLKSGAIPLLVSNTPEFCLSWESFNLMKGSTANPYDTTRTSGGSSGGEGALIGSGASLIGIGSDIAGSIRIPALFNGIFGHKPTPGIASIKGHYPHCKDERFQKFLVVGPMTRYSEDLRTMLKIMVNDKCKELRLDEKVDLGSLNLYTIEDASFFLTSPTVDSTIKRFIRKSAQYLKQQFNSNIIKDSTFLDISRANETYASEIYSIKDIPNVLKEENKLPVEIIKSLVGRGMFTFNVLVFYTLENIYKKYVNNYTKEIEALRSIIVDKLGTNGVIILPTWTNPAGRHHEFIFYLGSLQYITPANCLGLPATHVPCGLDKNGLPIGIQIMAAPNQDRLCLAVAEELEKAFGGWIPPS